MAYSAITFTAEEVSAYYAARMPHLKQSGAELRGPCPIHDGKDDNFAVEPNTGRWFCHSVCRRGGDILQLEMALTGGDFPTTKAEVFRLVGRAENGYGHNGTRRNANSARKPPPKAVKTIAARGLREIERCPYTDEGGELLFEVVRYLKPDGEKDFRQCRPDGRGGTIWNLDGVKRAPYRLPKLLTAETVFLPEGERDVHSLEEWGLVASCNPGGVGNGALYAQWIDYFRNRHIVILFDNDKPGREHAILVASLLLAVAASVRIVELGDLPEKGDFTDWKEAGGTIEQFYELVRAATPIDAEGLATLARQWGLMDDDFSQGQVEMMDGWPKPEPLQGELPPVEIFSEELLPTSFRPLVADVTERMQVPMDYAAVAVVLCLAGTVNRRAVIQPKANDTGWVVVPNLWGGIIAPPGFMKSPVIQAATRPLNQMQSEWRREHDEALLGYAADKEKYELRRAAWKEQYKSASKKNNSTLPERPEDEPQEPTPRRLIVNDATFEALHETMNENPAGILVIRDELTGWLSQLDRPGREGERAFCLQAWNGDTGHTIDRIGRGTIHVEACCMSMLGGIQPGRLRSYLVDALKDGPSNDGLIQRFQLLVWPDTASDWEYVDRAPNSAYEQRVAHVFQKMVSMDAENPVRFRFAPDAQELFVDWLAELEAKIRNADLHPALISHLSKYRKLMPALALLFELADRGEHSETLSDGDGAYLVSLEHAKQAAAWCDYLESHARRVYSCIVTPQLKAARDLADKIKHYKVGRDGVFSCRDVYLNGWSGLDSPEAVKRSAEVLVDAGWLRELPSESRPLGGRPSLEYQVNPRLWE